jgi:hypothetical protein
MMRGMSRSQKLENEMGSEQYSHHSPLPPARVNWLLVHSTAVDRSGCNHSRDSEDDLEGVADRAEWRSDDGSDGAGRGTENTALFVWRLGRRFRGL